MGTNQEELVEKKARTSNGLEDLVRDLSGGLVLGQGVRVVEGIV